MLFLKVASDNLRLSLSAPQVRPDLAHHFALVLRALAANRIGLHILVEQFIRIQLWTVSRQKDHPHGLAMGFEPLLHFSGTVNRMTIYNEVHVPPTVFHKPLEKLDHHRTGEPLFEHHECQ